MVSGFADAVAAPPEHAADEQRGRHGAHVAGGRPATVATHADSPVPGSSVDSTAGRGNADHSPCGDTPSTPDVSPWQQGTRLSYAPPVPWEVMLPWGRPGRIVSPPRALPLSLVSATWQVRRTMSHSPPSSPRTFPAHHRYRCRDVEGTERRRSQQTSTLRKQKSNHGQGDGEGDRLDEVHPGRKRGARRSGEMIV